MLEGGCYVNEFEFILKDWGGFGEFFKGKFKKENFGSYIENGLVLGGSGELGRVVGVWIKVGVEERGDEFRVGLWIVVCWVFCLE